MFAVVPTPRQLARQVEGSVKYDFGSTVAGATCLVAGESGTALDGGKRLHYVEMLPHPRKTLITDTEGVSLLEKNCMRGPYVV